jgi:hypothetical protein
VKYKGLTASEPAETSLLESRQAQFILIIGLSLADLRTKNLCQNMTDSKLPVRGRETNEAAPGLGLLDRRNRAGRGTALVKLSAANTVFMYNYASFNRLT